MKLSTSPLLLSLALGAAVADVDILDKDLSKHWSIFDPMSRGELVSEKACERVSGKAIHAKLPYVTGVSVECEPGSKGCKAIKPPYYGGTDRWLVTKIVVANDDGTCPRHDDAPAAISNSLGVQFYKQDSRGESSLPTYFGRMHGEAGEVSEKYATYTTCMKVPLFCRNVGMSFEGWSGITYENRPLVPEDCDGTLDFYIDSIKVSSKCPFNVENKDDYDTSYCLDRGPDHQEPDSQLRGGEKSLQAASANYCVFAPDYTCYESGWPKCCDKNGGKDCPSEQPGCDKSAPGYCIFAPDYDCYDAGWPACCFDNVGRDCPSEKPECGDGLEYRGACEDAPDDDEPLNPEHDYFPEGGTCKKSCRHDNECSFHPCGKCGDMKGTVMYHRCYDPEAMVE